MSSFCYKHCRNRYSYLGTSHMTYTSHNITWQAPDISTHLQSIFPGEAILGIDIEVRDFLSHKVICVPIEDSHICSAFYAWVGCTIPGIVVSRWDVVPMCAAYTCCKCEWVCMWMCECDVCQVSVCMWVWMCGCGLTVLIMHGTGQPIITWDNLTWG